MIKILTASTTEVDDEKLAVEHITSQLNSEHGFLKNTIGLISCHYEFVLSGILKSVCDAMPFDVTGTISSSQSVTNETGSLVLTLMVLTSDDVEFDMFLTPSLLPDPKQAITETYQSMGRTEKPGLILTYAPYILENTGDEYADILTAISGGVPCFGTLAVDDTADYSNCFMLANGEAYRDKMALVLIYGIIHPKFYVANISENKLFAKSVFVTKSVGPVLMEVNERPVIKFFEDLGLIQASETRYALASLPFLLDYNDGTPKVSKTFIALTPEKHAICAGAMPQGSTLYMTTASKEDVLHTTGTAIDTMLNELDGASGLLIYSCITRSMTLGTEQFKEMELVRQKIGTVLPFMMASSGGEFCPTQVSDKQAINRFHNNACIICVL